MPSKQKQKTSGKAIHFISLGCPKNRVDTEVMLGVASDNAYRIIPEAETADVIVVNTCGFIGEAKEESIATILEMAALKADNPHQKLVVTGCLSQRYIKTLQHEMPEVDYFLGTSDVKKLHAVLEALENPKKKLDRVLVGNPAEWTMNAKDSRILSEGSRSAYVKIAEGCNRSCAFCTIPSFRGKQRSRSIKDIVEEAKQLADQGVLELNIISQDTVSFGREKKSGHKEHGENLIRLLEALGEVSGVEWIRVFYLYPEMLTGPLLDVMASHPKIVKYLDMPLQHASGKMLKLMKRGVSEDKQRQVVENIRNKMPDVVFRTAFIVGHPHETEEDFDGLLSFVKWAEFDRVGVFQYSHEEGTPSGKLKDTVPEKTKAKRARELMKIQRPISKRKLKRFVGTTQQVLVEKISDESALLWEGRFFGQAPEIDGTVYLTGNEVEVQAGDYVEALVSQSGDHDLIAEPVRVLKTLRKKERKLKVLR